MPTIRIAVVDEQLSAQLSTSEASLEDVEVVWSGTDMEAFGREVPPLRPDALVVALEQLGDAPTAVTASLLEATGAQMVFVVYAFARGELLRELAEAQARPLRSPVSLDSLRMFLSGLMVRKLLGRDGTAPAPAARPASAAPRTPPGSAGALPATRGSGPGVRPPAADGAAIAPPRFTMAQLGRLKEIESAVECECPANLADLLTQLSAFERYSAGCESRNTKDAEIHHMLHEETARARMIMEVALQRLMDHESIEL